MSTLKLLGAAWTAALVLISVGAAGAQIPADQVPMLVLHGDAATPGFGQQLCGPGDLNGDAWADLVVGAPDENGSGPGLVVAFSGRDGSELYQLSGVLPGGAFGGALAAIGDVDHDGLGDVLVGSPAARAADLISGGTGASLHHFAAPPGVTSFGRWIAGPGDIDGDGTPDLLFGLELANSSRGALAVVSGASHQPLVWMVGVEDFDALGSGVAAAGDVNADGRPDYLARRFLGEPWTAGYVTCFSGANGSELFTTGAAQSFGPVGDLDADGFGEVILGNPQDGWPAWGTGYVQVYSWKQGKTLLWLFGSQMFGMFGRHVGGVGDVDQDGVPDYFINEGAPARTTVYSGATQMPIFVATADASSPGLGESAVAAGDVNGDGRVDLALGTSFASMAVVQTLAPPFAWLGQGLDATGPAPILNGLGTLVAGSSIAFTLAGALPGAPAMLVVGFSALEHPFKGGTMVPFPNVLVGGLVVDLEGGLMLSGHWPMGMPPGTSLYLQAWLVDAGGPAGFAASNALHAITP